MSFKDLEGQLARWLKRLQEYEFEIIHCRGLIHKNADGLSRRQCELFGFEYCAKVEKRNMEESRKSVARIILVKEFLQEWRKKQTEDPSISFIYHGKKTGVRPSRSEIPTRDEAHDSSSRGHFGDNKTLVKIRKRFYWATCKQDVEQWCKICKVCVSKNGPLGKGKSPLQIYNVGAPFERLQMDIFGPLPTTTSGNRCLLVIIDCFTKWVEAFPLKNIKARMVAEVFVRQIISRHRVSLKVHADQGKNFESKLFAELMNLFGIRKTRTTALHPQSDGQVERQHQTIINYLAKYISKNQKDWDRWVLMFLLAYRFSKHEITSVTPTELCFARDLKLPLDLLLGSPPKNEFQSVGGFVRNLKEKLERINFDVRERMDVKSRRTKSWYDRKAKQTLFQEGEKVWFYNPQRMKGRVPKLQSNWEGLFLIVRKLSDIVNCIQKSSRHKKKVVHADRLASSSER
ncbi:integrase core domain protein [Lasius niger]|uniref:RNA-directed DNA polymerase n=1 Tax=Lasius niger TaxID=67767 RepID=A0A0J7KPG2_LASNI|nr:integrase core domain protein [Lasius niger]